MFAVVLCSLLVAAALSAEIPTPKLNHLASGDVEISVEGSPGMKVYDVKYHIKGHKHHGPFHQGADGRWYHRINAAAYNGKDKIKYTIVGEIDGETVVTKGKLHPQERSVVLAPPRVLRACRTVFRDDFNGAFDASHWNYEVSMYGGYHYIDINYRTGNPAYVPEARNIFTRNGHLFIKPAMYGYCTNSDRWGCYRAGKDGLLPPVMSGKLKSKSTIRFGEVTVCARVPRGDWIWPAIWMLPRDSHYGQWPRSGEIDIMESRGSYRNIRLVGTRPWTVHPKALQAPNVLDRIFVTYDRNK